MPNQEKYRLAGVMGWPVKHSRSPMIHRYWLEQYAIAGDYILLAVNPSHIEKALRALPMLGFRGCNLTIPHKEIALPFLDAVSEQARRIGATNTIVVQDDGTLSGFNTDAFGFMSALTKARPDWLSNGGVCTVIGAGGASRAVVTGLLDAGVSQIRLVNRTFERAQKLAHELDPNRIYPIEWGEREDALHGSSLLVNTSSLGMSGQPPLEMRLDNLPLDALVYDIIFSPWETDLLLNAKARGNPILNGMPMLIEQARPGFEAWFDVMPDASDHLYERVQLLAR